MNVAIVIGVSDYGGAGKDLPACKNDVSVINSLLTKTGKYEHVLEIARDTSSAKLKDKLTSFITPLQDKQIEEVFFYFSGHGEYYQDHFYYLLTDYDTKRRNQTTLDNTELDTWLRSLNAGMTVKVVDACHSGVQYIKEPGAFQKYLQQSQSGFNKCYFFFSSGTSQCSYQDAMLSDFTRAFIDSIANHSVELIRLRDIADYIADQFSSSNEQIPLFVIQATNTEPFCKISVDLRETLLQIKTTISAAKPPITEAHTLSLVELIQKDAKRYCTEEELLQVFDAIRDYLPKHNFGDEFKALYQLQPDFRVETLKDLPDAPSIGSWISKSTAEVFARPTYVEEQYQEEVPVPKKAGHGFDLLYLYGMTDYETRKVTKTRKRITGFELTQKVPFNVLKLEAVPQHQNLKWHSWLVTFVFSKISLYFFIKKGTLREINWGDKTLSVEDSWSVRDVPLKPQKDAIAGIRQILRNYEDYIIRPLREQFLRESGADATTPEKKADTEVKSQDRKKPEESKK